MSFKVRKDNTYILCQCYVGMIVVTFSFITVNALSSGFEVQHLEDFHLERKLTNTRTHPSPLLRLQQQSEHMNVWMPKFIDENS